MVGGGIVLDQSLIKWKNVDTFVDVVTFISEEDKELFVKLMIPLLPNISIVSRDQRILSLKLMMKMAGIAWLYIHR